MKKILVVLLFLTLTLCQSFFNSNATFTCMHTNLRGSCIQWSQSMNTTQSLACFPAHTRVMTRSGLIRIDAIKRGDFVLGLENGYEVYTEVTSWYHHDPEATAEFLEIGTKGGFFQVSGKHNMALEDLTYKFANELKEETLFGLGKVDSVNQIQNKGLFAPKTRINNFFVYMRDNKDQKALAHCIAHIRNPQSYQYILNLIENTWDFFSPSNQTIHPSYIFLHKMLPFLLEQ